MKRNVIFLLTALLPTAFVTAQISDGDYPVAFDRDQTYTHASRHLNGVVLKSADGEQTAGIAGDKVYNALLDKAFAARAGETVSATFNFSGTWMHGYVYLDRGNDGQFDALINSDGTIPAASDIMAFSYVKADIDSETAYNSKGETVSNANVLNPPSFTLPADLAPGYYRMRYKVDWNAITPAGSMTEGNDIITNGGAICDIRLNIHGDHCKVTAGGDNGKVLTADGKSLENAELPFGRPFTIRLQPAEGYAIDGLTIRHGYNLDGEALVHGTPQYAEQVIPGYLIKDNTYELPAGMMDGDVRITAAFKKNSSTVGGEDYPYTYKQDIAGTELPETALMRRIAAVATQGGKSEVRLTEQERLTTYRNLTDRKISVCPGDEVSVKMYKAGSSQLSGTLRTFLYIDLNQDGQFDAALDAEGKPTLSGELVAYNHYNGKNSLGQSVEDKNLSDDADLPLPAFNVPEVLPIGMYRARLVVAADSPNPAGDNAEATATDFLMNVHSTDHRLDIVSTHGSIHGASSNGLPARIVFGRSQLLRPEPIADGYEAETMTIRHGHNIDGLQFVHGNRQWSEFSVPANSYTLPADSVDGQVRVTVNFKNNDSEYTLVFNDEFSGTDGSMPDASRWVRCGRYSSTWNRWLSINDEEHALTAFQEDGKLIARALPNPFTATDNVPMITGGVKTMGKFGFTYGKVECRARNNPWTGNFPAIWLMPEDQSAGWPNCGEIDIWEVIDAQPTSYHTVHSNWTYNLGNKNNPQSSFNISCSPDYYHTYGLEWDETSITWYVDGRAVGTYRKSSSADALSKGQWPFDKHFHIILNQSVGNNSWAANADVNHLYQTEFDWIRVYQKEGQPNTGVMTAIETPATAIDLSVERSHIHLNVPGEQRIVVSDLSGRTVWSNHMSGEADIPVARGLYVVNGHKVLVP